jgi:molybdenum cofactor cytidylyltransferase
LAAGESQRLGRFANKLLLPFEGRPLLQHAIDVAARSRAMTCTLVVGADAQRVLQSVEARRCSIVENRDWKQGIASSINAGLALHRRDEACVFMVADQPFNGVEDVDRLIAHHMAEREAIIALRAGDVWGTPVIFPQRDFDALAKLRGDAGAKRYAERHVRRLRFVTALSRHAFTDIDTPTDYERARQIDPRT